MIFTPQIQAWVLASEAGYSDHPKDPGGATNMGITHRTLAAWRKVPSVTKQAVKDLTRKEALAIYEANYWRTSGADRLPEGLDYAVFDYAVNSGPARAVKDLQRVVGAGVDGVFGSQTLAAVERYGAVRAIEGLTAWRQAYVRGLRNYATFGRGWERRIADVAAKAGKMAVGLKVTDKSTVPARPIGEATSVVLPAVVGAATGDWLPWLVVAGVALVSVIILRVVKK